MALRSAVLQVEQQHCSIWLPEKTFIQADFYIVYNTGQAPRTYVRAMRECDTPRPVTFWREGAPLVYEFQLSSRESQWDVDVDWVWGLENVDVVLVHWSLEGEGEPRA